MMSFPVERKALPSDLQQWDTLLFDPVTDPRPSDFIVIHDRPHGLRVVKGDAIPAGCEAIGAITEGRRRPREPAGANVTLRLAEGH